MLFNNAGIGAPPVPLEDLPFETWQNVVATNLTGMFLCTQEAIKIMKAQNPRGGRIINNGSISAHTPRPVLGRLYRDQARGHRPDQVRPRSIAGNYDICCGQIDIGNAATPLTERMVQGEGVLQPDGRKMIGAAHGRRRRRQRGRLHGEPAARHQRAVHDGDGQQDAVRRARLARGRSPMLEHWHEFYVLVGTAGATLVALLFVAVSLGAGFLTDKQAAATRTFYQPGRDPFHQRVLHLGDRAGACAPAGILSPR